MKTFKIVLSERGKEIFKGGNIEPMSKPLNFVFRAVNIQKAESVKDYKITEVLGSASLDYYAVEEVV